MRRLETKWQTVALLFCIGAVNYGDRTAISAVFPLLRAELGTSDVALAAIGSAFLWSYSLASPVAGFFADRLSRSRIVVWSLIAWSLITAVTGLVPNVGSLLFTRVLLGLAECAYLPAAVALIADHHPTETRATANGIHLAGLNFGLVAGGALAGYLGEHFGWRLNFFVLGGAGLLLAAMAQRWLQDGPEVRNAGAALPAIGSIRALVHVPSYLVILAEAMLIAVGTWMFLNWLPLYFKERFQMSLAGAGFSGTFMLQLAGSVGVAAGGYLSDRVAGKHPERRMLVMCICYFLAAPFLLAFFVRAEYGLLSLSIFGYSLFRSLGSSNECPIICDVLEPRLRSTALGLMNTLNTFAGGVGIMLAGLLKSEYGLGGIFSGVSALICVSAAIALAGYLFFLRGDLQRRSIAAAEALALAKTEA
jgi:predicted MFS family arabinose efflux permease